MRLRTACMSLLPVVLNITEAREGSPDVEHRGIGRDDKESLPDWSSVQSRPKGALSVVLDDPGGGSVRPYNARVLEAQRHVLGAAPGEDHVRNVTFEHLHIGVPDP